MIRLAPLLFLVACTDEALGPDIESTSGHLMAEYDSSQGCEVEDQSPIHLTFSVDPPSVQGWDICDTTPGGAVMCHRWVNVDAFEIYIYVILNQSRVHLSTETEPPCKVDYTITEVVWDEPVGP